MRLMTTPALLICTALLCMSFPAVAENSTTDDSTVGDDTVASFSHDDWSAIVEKYVNEEGMVDYVGLKKNRAGLDRYLERLAKIGPQSRPDLFPSRSDALAYYLNAYNASVFKGVLAGGGEQKSVWGNMLAGYKFFVGTKYVIDGKKMSLKHLEDKFVREDFQDPRIHAALICASISCPRLQRWAFTGAKLEEQLDAVITEFATHRLHVRPDAAGKTVYLSKIYDWYKGDFEDYEKTRGEKNPSVIAYINRYRPADQQIPTDYRISVLPYDKGLNRQ